MLRRFLKNIFIIVFSILCLSSCHKKVEKDNISVTRDTIIKTLHDTIIQLDTKIVEINKNNEEIRNTIINQSVDSDCVFFAEYLQISESNK